MARWKHGEAACLDLSGQGVEHLTDSTVVEQAHSHRVPACSAGKMSKHVAANAKRPAPEFIFVALVLHLGQARIASRCVMLALAQQHDHAVIGGIADTVDARPWRRSRRRDVEQRLRRRQAHLPGCSLIDESFSMNRSRDGTYAWAGSSRNS
jgi:hypothetical protein